MTEETDEFKELRCIPLESSQLGQVFPLAREVLPDLDLAGWRRYASALIAKDDDAQRGILAVRNNAGYFCGLAIYHLVPANAGALLVADHFVVFDLLGRTEVSDVLLTGLDALARHLGCAAVETSLATPRDRLVKRFRAAGHNPKSMLMSKRLAVR
jgi:hypothetical protein